MMSILDFSRQLRELVEDYANERVAFEDYRAKRKEILDEIDLEKNGIDLMNDSQTNINASKINSRVDRLIGMLKKDEE
ncbi:hypothetical protein [Aliikangiella coralliicola]|uniref:Uncharacterized protein n=1 Tax=Aliikangiella coralliicola TaxID=2592383 RepID=A0A545U8T2_9GAMM|nr:hypothetical protein [Aliikangiella coralliicola]TQV85876.1 hypothetical protein FLL46_18305 [Aliikangiella coralliicola]